MHGSALLRRPLGRRLPSALGASPGAIGRAARRGWASIRIGLEADRDRLVLWLAPLVGTGIVLYFALRSEPSLRAGLIPVLVLLPLLGLARRNRIAHALVAALLAVSVGFLAAQLSTLHRSPLPVLPRKAALLTGRVGAVDLMPDGRRRVTLNAVTMALAAPPAGGVSAALEQTDRSFRVRLRPDDEVVLHVGDHVRLRALLRPPPAPDFPGGRDGQRDAFFGGQAGSGRALSDAILLAPASEHGVRPWLRRTREAVAARILQILPGPRGAVAATMLTGLGASIPQSDRDAFAASGLAHLLAVAGLHLGVVMMFGLAIVRFGLASWEWAALRLPCRQIAAVCALVLGAGYMLLTGLHLPGLRSLAMASVAALGLLIGRRAVSMRGLGFAALLILLASPATLLDVGFQMSFAAVLALLAGYEAVRPLSRRLHGPHWRGKLALYAFQLVFTSLLAGSASLPYAAFHFGRVQFYFVLANLLAVPITAFWVLPQGMLALLAMPFGLDWPFLRAMGGGIDLILLLAHGVAALPAASLPVPLAPVWGLLAVSFGLIWLCLWRRRWRFLAVLPIVFGCASPWMRAEPDLLVSSDAGLIAVREPGALLLEAGGRGDPMALSDWQKALARPAPPVPLPDSGTPAADVTCNPVACLLQRSGRTALLMQPSHDKPGDDDETTEESGLEPGDCDDVSVFVSPSPSRGACPGIPRIDRFTVWREGPQAVWLAPGGVRIWSARKDRGRRPWVPLGPGRPGPALPMAKAE
ncbi:ComEC/Rec2 family competence protein [Acetobacteraceae bacterium KSS8]|uniref:ComEC/Rec2 family competence protein n=1 Tax=Endosaccharibacter trunci TaxID=2812733 RepID=A0ABT1W9C7_9PROT|nr:ComEC/Rec2 family competence protein [Acetobacteraceae bacterium KSS8]